MPLSEGTITLPDGTPISYCETGGGGPALILAHPFTGNELSWHALMPRFAEAGYRVVAYSRRGYYRSGPVGEGAAQADDLSGLLDALGIQAPVDLVGVGAGTTVVFDFMLSFPQRAGRGVAAAGLMAIDEPLVAEARTLLQPGWFLALPHEARELSASFRYRNAAAIEDWLRIFHLNHLDHATPPQPARSVITFAALRRLGSRLMLLGGEGDLYAPPALLEAAARELPQARFKVLRQCGHAPHVEVPDAFAVACLHFLQS